MDLPGWMNWEMAELWMTEEPLMTYKWIGGGKGVRHRLKNQQQAGR